MESTEAESCRNISFLEDSAIGEVEEMATLALRILLIFCDYLQLLFL